jgi:sigma-B regulation protein RsbU (phosphoserine phosphatase)
LSAFNDQRQQQPLRKFLAARETWMAAFEELVQIIQERDALIIQEVQPLDQAIANLSEEIKLSLKTDQDSLGPSVQAANAVTARAVLTGSFLAFGLAFLIALLFLRAINRSITALGLSEAETERLSREITARKETERKLASALQEVERVNFLSDIALELTGCGYWHVDHRDLEYYYLSPQAARILGEPWKEDGRYHLREEWLTRIQAASPESAERVLERYEDFIGKRLNNHDATYPYQRPIDGKTIWIHALGRVVRDEHGEICNMYGAYQDITRRVEAENSSQKAKDRAEEHASEMKRSLNAAAEVQQSLLPTSKPESQLVDFAWRYLPCDELAGDFLNFFALDDQHVAVFVIDVSGHGVASSLLSVTIGRMMTPQVSSTSLLVQRTKGNTDTRILLPSEVASKLNRRFPMNEKNNLFFTMLYGVLNLQTRQFRYVTAGHEPPVLMPQTGPPRVLDGGGLAIGWIEDAEYKDYEITLQPSDRLYVYSDGVPEAVNAETELFSTERMQTVIAGGKSRSLDQSVGLLLESVTDWCGNAGLGDDVSIIGMEMSEES